MQKITISIAMATYNGALFLEEQLRSLAEQSFLPYELVVCDDGSRDETIDILRNFAQSSPFPVRILQNETNLGYADNFMKASALCEGDYVAFCDQDDIWNSEKLEVAANAFINSQVMLFSHGCQLISASGAALRDPEYVIPDGCYRLADLDPLNAFFGFSCVFRRSLLALWDSGKRPIDLISDGRLLAHDRWIYFLATSTGLVVYNSRPLALYRQHGNNFAGSEEFRKKSKFSVIKSVFYKYNNYIYKRSEISRVMNDVVIHLSECGEAYEDNYLLSVYKDMSGFYRSRLELFRKPRFSALVDVLKLKFSGLYDLPRRYSNNRAFWEDIIAIIIARRTK
ncbi:glycosyltransferase [Acetobacter musti]|uniref:Glycosyltransferase n=1 Tax=Acetobacter musti TaxID=864732 RepID=A0ABX0JKE8_9PROT|nr:glycosyltransferase family 2 protein [Acetobacter musti]NHN83948.1 glycosyltransferase [Acetobacter musti]